MRNPNQGGKGACGGLYRFLPTLQFLADLAGSAPDEVRVGVAVVTDDVLGGDLGGEVWFAAHVVADLEEGGADTLSIQDAEQLLRVGMAGAVVEGQGDHPLAGTGVPEDLTVEPGTGREPLVDH